MIIWFSLAEVRGIDSQYFSKGDKSIFRQRVAQRRVIPIFTLEGLCCKEQPVPQPFHAGRPAESLRVHRWVAQRAGCGRLAIRPSFLDNR
jgi:hypothetical protein